MKVIQRQYLNRLIDVMGTPDIKVITGVRRSGKSKLLSMFEDYIRRSVEKCNIISINFNGVNFDELREYRQLHNYIEAHYKPGHRNFVLIDEVQMCDGFERVINSLHASENYDIYITGSNAFLLSSDLATLFTGRTFEIEIFPFSFRESNQYYDYADLDEAFDRYVRGGGLAGSYAYAAQIEKYRYIENVFNALIVRDIQQKYNIRNIDMMDRLFSFLMDNISNLTSVRKITNQLNQNKLAITDKTIANYLMYLCNAFAFYKIRRYDIQGRRYLSSTDKYYLVDHAVRYAKLGTKNEDRGRVYENIVAIELLRRGYDVYVGVLQNKEIDFVAIKHDEQLYIQVSDDISGEKTLDREISPLLKVKDAYPKIVIARTKQSKYQYEGVQIFDIARWLAGEE